MGCFFCMLLYSLELSHKTTSLVHNTYVYIYILVIYYIFNATTFTYRMCGLYVLN